MGDPIAFPPLKIRSVKEGTITVSRCEPVISRPLLPVSFFLVEEFLDGGFEGPDFILVKRVILHIKTVVEILMIVFFILRGKSPTLIWAQALIFLAKKVNLVWISVPMGIVFQETSKVSL